MLSRRRRLRRDHVVVRHGRQCPRAGRAGLKLLSQEHRRSVRSSYIRGGGDDALKALTTALEIFRALAADAKGVDQGVAEACKHWVRHLDKMLQDVKTEVAALSKRMGDTQHHKITEVVDLPHAKAVAADREA